jgi:diguanylate cyclase (GGDEF)-like protein
VALSRQIGFHGHLKARLVPSQVARKVRARARVELATRLRAFSRRVSGRMRRQELSWELVRAADATLEPEKIADLILARMAKWVGGTGWAVVEADLGGRLSVLSTKGISATLVPTVLAVANWVLRHERQFWASDLRLDRRVVADARASVAAVPLACRGRTFGALVGFDRVSATHNPGGMEKVLGTLVQMVDSPAVALQNAVLRKRAEALSVTDDLTQLYNSRHLNKVLRQETKRSVRSGRPLSLLFVDLDGFKGINDRYGHLAGSRALVEAADVIRQSARDTDVSSRFGGDEFAVVLPDTGPEGALLVARRIRERIAAHTFLADEGINYRLTASVGVATLPEAATTPEELLKAADRAMYHVKDRGKDGIEVSVG